MASKWIRTYKCNSVVVLVKICWLQQHIACSAWHHGWGDKDWWAKSREKGAHLVALRPVWRACGERRRIPSVQTGPRGSRWPPLLRWWGREWGGLQSPCCMVLPKSCLMMETLDHSSYLQRQKDVVSVQKLNSQRINLRSSSIQIHATFISMPNGLNHMLWFTQALIQRWRIVFVCVCVCVCVCVRV